MTRSPRANARTRRPALRLVKGDAPAEQITRPGRRPTPRQLREMRRLAALPVPPNDPDAQIIHDLLVRQLARYGTPPGVA